MSRPRKPTRVEPDLLDAKVPVILTVNEMITVQAALNVATEHKAVTPETADSVFAKLDIAIERWALVG